ncbi:MAG TPA: 2,3,4,5-tetrahydropyridine-2,6-dicarboxylate N-succinyltransferase [Candidatus Sulfomarinibacteraceae bacterium]|nr:2,3,4,5-tetrahydropyridine-2,6-dicarboxylate N-succinyltransferase [Candidatus Sulfomarinibacteraceae bacterium]
MIAEHGEPRPPDAALDPATILDDLESGRVRAAAPDPGDPSGWRVDPAVKLAILARFADRTTVDWSVGPLEFRDRAAVPPRALAGGPWRIVPGGTSIRAGVHLEPGVVVMPPSYVNVGAWIGAGTMVDSHVLVGSCAQVGDRVHLAAGVLLGGVLEPPGARPVIVEDDVFVGAGSVLLDGILVRRGAVIAAGVTLTGTSRLYDLVEGRVIQGSLAQPLVVPERAVVIPGTRSLDGPLAATHGLAVMTALIVKTRDAGTDARVALEAALR